MRSHRISIWAHPRSRSTVLEKAFSTRDDCTVEHELFANYYYVYLDALPISKANTDESDAMTLEEVLNRILAKNEKCVVHKDFPYHFLDTDIDKSQVSKLLAGHNFFLVRNPKDTIRSLLRIQDEVTEKNLGIEDLYRLFLSPNLDDRPRFVIDADVLATSPSVVVSSICENAGLTFNDSMLQWDPEMNASWKKWKEWHKDVANSTSFVPPKSDSHFVDNGIPANLFNVWRRSSKRYAAFVSEGELL